MHFALKQTFKQTTITLGKAVTEKYEQRRLQRESGTRVNPDSIPGACKCDTFGFDHKKNGETQTRSVKFKRCLITSDAAAFDTVYVCHGAESEMVL